MTRIGKKPEEFVFGMKERLDSPNQVERMMDNAAGVIKLLGAKNICYFNFIVDVTSHCDCMPAGGLLLVQDQGILFSNDPVAIDQASSDIIAKAPGLPQGPIETGVQGPAGEIPPKPELLESGQKLGIFSRFCQEEFREEIVDIQLTAAERLGLGSRDYELKDVTTEKASE